MSSQWARYNLPRWTNFNWEPYHLTFLHTFQDFDAGAKFQASLSDGFSVETPGQASPQRGLGNPHRKCRSFQGKLIHQWYPLVNVYSLRTGKSPCSMGKSTISMAMFNSYVKLPEGTFSSKLLISRSPKVPHHFWSLAPRNKAKQRSFAFHMTLRQELRKGLGLTCLDWIATSKARSRTIVTIYSECCKPVPLHVATMKMNENEDALTQRAQYIHVHTRLINMSWLLKSMQILQHVPCIPQNI